MENVWSVNIRDAGALYEEQHSSETMQPQLNRFGVNVMIKSVVAG